MSSSFSSRIGNTPNESVKAPCVAATTANITLSGNQVIDSVGVVNGDRVLVKDQTDASENGVYVVSTSAWSRAPDWDTDGDVVSGVLVMDTNQAVMYAASTAKPFVLGVSTVAFNELLSATPGDVVVTIENADYCPGYMWSVTSSTTLRAVFPTSITNLFKAGRRVRVTYLDGTEYLGAIASSSYTDTGTPSTCYTDMTLTVDDSGSLPTGQALSSVCLTSSETAWSPIANSPFEGTAINAVVSGEIASVVYTIAVGNNGKAFYSLDGGDTWTAITTGTTEHLNDICYDSLNEAFYIVGNNITLLKSTNGTTVTAVTNDLANDVTTGSGAIWSIEYAPNGNALMIVLDYNSDYNGRAQYSLDGGATWANKISISSSGNTSRRAAMTQKIGASQVWVPQTSYLQPFSSLTTTSSTSDLGNGVGAIVIYYLGRTLNGNTCDMTFTETGYVYHEYSAGAYRDDVTFSGPIFRAAWSPTLGRTVAVGVMGQIGYLDDTDIASQDAWTLVPNGFAVTDTINDIHWDSYNNVFIAVSEAGVICKSTNGIN